MEQLNRRTPFSRWKPIEIMLAILFLVAPFYYHTHLGGTGLKLPNNITIWFVGMLIILGSVQQICRSRKVFIPRRNILFIAFPVLITFVSFINDVKYPLDWTFRLLAIWGGYLFFIGLLQANIKRQSIDKLLFMIVVSALCQSLIGAIQANMPALLPTEWIPPSRSLSPFGMFQQINNQVTFLVTSILLGFYLLTRPIVDNGGKTISVVLLLFFCVASYVITLSGSRIGILSFIISFPLFLYARKRFLLKYRQHVIPALCFVFIGIVLGASGLVTVLDKTNKMGQGLGADARLEIYKISSDLVRQNPISGYGIGSFVSEYHKQKIQFNKQNDSPEDLFNEYLTHPHNEILFWMIETGLLGFIGIVIFISAVILTLKDDIHRLSYFAFILPIALHTQVELPFYTSALHWFLFLFLLYLFVNTGAERSEVVILSHSMNRLLKLIVLPLTTFILVSFFIHTLISCYEIGKKQNVWQLHYSKQNPYFAKLVELMQYKTLFLDSNRQKSKEGIEQFVEWGRAYIDEEPSEQMYMFMGMAYANIGDIENKCKYTKEGILLYPKSENLQQIYEGCKSDK